MSASTVNNDSISIAELFKSVLPKSEMFKALDLSAYQQDSNGGSYASGQINFQTDPLTKNSWCDVYNSVLNIPVQITVQAGTWAFTNFNAFTAGLKFGGIMALIDSVNCTVNGTSLVMGSRQNHLYSSIRALTNYSMETTATQADSFMMYPDSMDSWIIGSIFTAASIAYTNNVNTPAVPSNATNSYNPSTYNDGFYKRCALSQFPTIISGVTTYPLTLKRNYYTTGASVGNVNIFGFIRLRDICSAIYALDSPMRNFNMTLQLQLNTVSNATGVSVGSLQGSSNPVMYGTNAIAAASLTNVACSVMPNQSCRLYIPQLQLPAEVEATLPANPITVRKFRDFQYVNYGNALTAGSPISWNVTSSQQNLKSVSICCFLHGSNNAILNASIYQQMFSPEPGIPGSPLCSLTNAQLYVNGSPIARNQEQYLPEQFMHIVQQNRLNDGQDSLFGSSTFGQDKWMRGCPGFLQYDCTRVTENQPASVSLNFQATNQSVFAYEVIGILEFERTLEFDHSTGVCRVTTD